MKTHPGRAIASNPAIAPLFTTPADIVLLTLNVPLGPLPLSAPHDDIGFAVRLPPKTILTVGQDNPFMRLLRLNRLNFSSSQLYLFLGKLHKNLMICKTKQSQGFYGEI
jgi:hypothetical protein